MPTGMGNPTKRAARRGPTRRKVLTTALAAGAGVAGARMLGLRDLGTTATADAMLDIAAIPADAMGMYGAEEDALALIPDDAYFGPQDLDASVLPEARAAATLPPVAASRSVSSVGQLQPAISGITAPRLAGDLDWVSPLANESAMITHLLRRATFGYTEAELDRALSEGYARTVDRLIETPFAEPPAFGARPAATPTPRASATPSPRMSPSAPPIFIVGESTPTPMTSPRPSASPSATVRPTASANPMTSASSAPAASSMPSPSATPAPMLNNASINLQNLQIWWLDWMTQSSTPFGETMTLFWHGHFTSDYRKVGTNSPAMYWQNLTWRRMAMGDLKSMLLKVTPDLAML
ncbi:MAG TPA: DUF1800 family protein, partial [Candidatus Limnocylindrales bacterium]|nr:DUF1800 family protein [Candidatus Limnocylindrales bacterium]